MTVAERKQRNRESVDRCLRRPASTRLCRPPPQTHLRPRKRKTSQLRHHYRALKAHGVVGLSRYRDFFGFFCLFCPDPQKKKRWRIQVTEQEESQEIDVGRLVCAVLLSFSFRRTHQPLTSLPLPDFLNLWILWSYLLMERILKVRKKSGNRERCRKLSL